MEPVDRETNRKVADAVESRSGFDEIITPALVYILTEK